LVQERRRREPPGSCAPAVPPASENACGSGAAAQVTPCVVELGADLAPEEHDGRDDGQRDQGNQEDVLDEVCALLVLGEPGLQPRPQEEQVHQVAPSVQLIGVVPATACPQPKAASTR